MYDEVQKKAMIGSWWNPHLTSTTNDACRVAKSINHATYGRTQARLLNTSTEVIYLHTGTPLGLPYQVDKLPSGSTLDLHQRGPNTLGVGILKQDVTHSDNISLGSEFLSQVDINTENLTPDQHAN